jgi:hypothetical protein
MTKVMTGGCLCGHVRYEIDQGIVSSRICHCRMCQKQSGAPMVGLMFIDADNLRITAGDVRGYQSSVRGLRSFCGNCGSPLFWQPTAGPNLRAVFAGSFDDPNAFQPEIHICTSSAVSWLNVVDDLPRYPKNPPMMKPTLRYDSTTGNAVERE